MHCRPKLQPVPLGVLESLVSVRIVIRLVEMAVFIFSYKSFSGYGLPRKDRPFGVEALCSFKGTDGWELSADIWG